MRRARVAAAVAGLLASASAAGFVRTRDRTSGTELAWPLPAVAWHLNRDWPSTSPSCQATAAGDPALAAVQASFAAWEVSCTDLRLLYAGTTPEIRTGGGGTGENVVVFRRGWCSQHPQAAGDPCMDDPDVDCGGIYDCFEDACPPSGCTDWNIVALTSVLYDPETGRIMNADIEVNGWDGGSAGGALPQSAPPRGWYFTCSDVVDRCATYGEADCRHMDLRNTVTHEVGHFIGLAHAPDPTATMFARTDAGEVVKRDLSADDVAGVCAIYPQADGGGCGCGSGEAAGALALAVAVLALRRRVVRRAPPP